MLKDFAKGHDTVWVITIKDTNKDKGLEAGMIDEYPYIKRWTQPLPVQMYAIEFSKHPLD